jgi:sugar phosphate isomerase/epimerase
MAAVPLGVQLYSVRDALAEDFEGVMRRVADVGYAAVEFAGVYGSGGPAQAAALARSLGMEVIAAHLGLPEGDDMSASLDVAKALGARYWVVPWLPPETFATQAQVSALVERLNRAGRAAQREGITLLYHNHWFEFEPVEALGGLTPFEAMLPELDPAVGFEVDLYWVRTAGNDPAATLAGLGERAPLLHLKDGPANLTDAMVALGDGVMDYPSLLPHARAQWLLVELDRCDGDIFEALERSYAYVTTSGLAHGRA